MPSPTLYYHCFVTPLPLKTEKLTTPPAAPVPDPLLLPAVPPANPLPKNPWGGVKHHQSVPFSLLQKVKRVVGIELCQEAVEDARVNAHHNGESKRTTQ